MATHRSDRYNRQQNRDLPQNLQPAPHQGIILRSCALVWALKLVSRWTIRTRCAALWRMVLNRTYFVIRLTIRISLASPSRSPSDRADTALSICGCSRMGLCKKYARHRKRLLRRQALMLRLMLGAGDTFALRDTRWKIWAPRVTMVGLAAV